MAEDEKPTVAFLGPASSYTHQAALSRFPTSEHTLTPLHTISDIFAAVQQSSADYGVVPFENSSNGSVVFTLDLIADREGKYPDILVDAEVYVSVVHCLLGRKAPSKATDGTSEVEEKEDKEEVKVEEAEEGTKEEEDKVKEVKEGVTEEEEDVKKVKEGATEEKEDVKEAKEGVAEEEEEVKTVKEGTAEEEEDVKEVKEGPAEEEKPSQKTEDPKESLQPSESAVPAEPPALPSTVVLTLDSEPPDLSHLTKLYSHPQAWGQCTRFLSSSPELKTMERQDVSSTSRAAQLVAEDESGLSAAISSKLAAAAYGLDILREGIEDRKNNTTRFLVLRRGNPGEGDVKGIDEDELVEEMVKVVEGKEIIGEEILEQKEGEWEEKMVEYEEEEDRNEKERDDSVYDYYRVPTSEPPTTILVTPSVEPPKVAAVIPAVSPSPKHATHKTLLTFTISHSNPGALAASLSVFSKHGLNLTSINTRPSGVENWNYIFFVELQGRREEDGNGEVNAALKELWDVCKGLRWLGSWENALAKQS